MCPSCLPLSLVLAGVAGASATDTASFSGSVSPARAGGSGGYGVLGGLGSGGGIGLCMGMLLIGGNMDIGCGNMATRLRSTDPTGSGDEGQIPDTTCPG